MEISKVRIVARMGSRSGKHQMVVVLVLVVVLQALLMAEATISVFHNRGTLSGWDLIVQQHDGTVEQVTDEWYKSPTSLKCKQVYDGSYNGRYHSQVVKYGAYQRGDVGFYGFAFKLQPDWLFTIKEPQRYVLAEFVSDFTDASCGNSNHPTSSMVYLEGDKLYSQVKTGDVCNPTTTTFSNYSTVSAGHWHKVVFGVYWASDSTGYYKLWFDDVLVINEANIATTFPDTRSFQFRVGLYAIDWHDEGRLVGSQRRRSIWVDQIGIGPSKDDANPDTWS